MERYVYATRDLRYLVESGILGESAKGSSVWLSAEFLEQNTMIDRSVLVAALFSEPDQDQKPLTQITPLNIVLGVHHGRKDTLRALGRSIEVYDKPFQTEDGYRAKNDFRVNIIARERGIRTVMPFALTRNPNTMNWRVFTIYDHQFKPLATDDVVFTSRDISAYSADQFLNDRVRAIAELHNAGIALNDMNHGNIGDFSQGPNRPAVTGFIDFENALWLDEENLERKNNGYSKNDAEFRKNQKFEYYTISDLMKFAGQLILRGFPINQSKIIEQSLSSYLRHRGITYPFEDNYDMIYRERVKEEFGL